MQLFLMYVGAMTLYFGGLYVLGKIIPPRWYD